jgi:D-alanyl-lipoteichoic acid acyltransferase DltB (MBOAT superfamily)
MLSSTFTFVFFGILVALVMAARPSLAWRQNVMLAASVIFVGSLSRNPLAFLPLIGFLAIGYVALRFSAGTLDRAPALSIAVIVLLFVWLKRYSIVPNVVWLPYAYLTVGLSYILFRLLHLVIESRDDAAIAQIGTGDYLRYLIGWNTFVAGPIMFYGEYVEQQRAMANGVTLEDVGEGIQRIVIGLFKASVLAMLLSTFRADALTTFRGFGSVREQTMAGVAVFALYPLFLYCNFSGYIDIVIGLSRLMGQRLPENFDHPFGAGSVIEFWNRWHITLSRWLKTYVFNPMLIWLLRRFPARRLEPWWATLAFFVTFSLVGVWHGQTTAFLLFGFLTGLGISVNKAYQVLMARAAGKQRYARMTKNVYYRTIARGLNFTWFAFTLTWFWGTWSTASSVWAATSMKRWVLIWTMMLLLASLLLALWEALYVRWKAVEWSRVAPLPRLRMQTALLTTLVLLVVAVAFVSSQSAPELVYKDF